MRKAVALQYDAAEHAAPEVVASGRGPIADKIIELAKAHGVHIKEDPDLVEVLSRLQVGDAIPPELYAVVAEILAFVYRVNAKRRPHDGPPHAPPRPITRERG
ncbi:MAG: FhlB domain-containing protein [Candidatus Methylomirabilota bacterium]|nr:MAG: FhlB domain-containing protein [candidate division NC10 bacterium]